ncbi:MAG: hypothetical protein Q3M30_02635 [Candidatus Electrothrix sp. Rat3]|nr:hypothetical protein [Candidatus Electrothrix rattekaaiensis]
MLHLISEEEYKTKLITLAYACPLEHEPHHCPLKQVRERNFSGKKQWINSLSLPTKQTIYKYHMACYAKNK